TMPDAVLSAWLGKRFPFSARGSRERAMPRLILIGLVSILLFGCGTPEEASRPKIARPANVRPPDVAPIIAGNREFAVALYQQLAQKEGNLFFSPYSVSTALAMTYAGARGETARQMKATL